MIYFIRYDNMVKIGYSVNPMKRFHKMQSDFPFKLVLLNSFEGDVTLEKSLHYYYKDRHIRGEWFSYTEGMEYFKDIPHVYYKNKVGIEIARDQAKKIADKATTFICKSMFTKKAWDHRDVNEVKNKNVLMTGCANESRYLGVLEVNKALKGPKFKNKDLAQMLGITVPTVVNYKKIIKKYQSYYDEQN